jgi:hypothetical protein
MGDSYGATHDYSGHRLIAAGFRLAVDFGHIQRIAGPD